MKASYHLNVILFLIIAISVAVPSCADSQKSTSNEESNHVVESVQEEAAKTEDSGSKVPYNVDANGVPSPEYQEYLYNELQKEEAMNSLVEEAQREMLEYEYITEPHGFPY